MRNPNLTLPKRNYSPQFSFKRREYLPYLSNKLWQIETGVVRTYTFTEDGTIINLGFWTSKDIIGQPLAGVQPYQIECLTDVQVCALSLDECPDLYSILLSHLHQSQELLRMRTGQIPQRLEQFLDWLAHKFGHPSEQGNLIKIRLTHQDFADTLGTTRVTITRLMSQWERENRIRWVHQHLLLPCRSGDRLLQSLKRRSIHDL